MELLRKAYGKEGHLRPLFTEAHRRNSEKIAGITRLPHGLLHNKPRKRPLPDIFQKNARNVLKKIPKNTFLEKFYTGLINQAELTI